MKYILKTVPDMSKSPEITPPDRKRAASPLPSPRAAKKVFQFPWFIVLTSQRKIVPDSSQALEVVEISSDVDPISDEDSDIEWETPAPLHPPLVLAGHRTNLDEEFERDLFGRTELAESDIDVEVDTKATNPRKSANGVDSSTRLESDSVSSVVDLIADAPSVKQVSPTNTICPSYFCLGCLRI